MNLNKISGQEEDTMKKFLAVLLSVLMLLSVAPIAFAQETTTEKATVVEDAENAEGADESLSAAGDLFGGFFVKLGEMLQIIFNFLSNLFNGTGDTNIDFM